MTANANLKYELIESDIPGMFRIRALKDFANVESGDIGGYAAGPDNLSQLGTCWLYGNSRMYDNSRMHGNSSMHDNSCMYGNSSMYGNSRMYGNAQLHWTITETPVTVNTSDGYTMAYNKENNKISAGCRYFTVDEAVQHWTDTRGGTSLGEERLKCIEALLLIAR